MNKEITNWTYQKGELAKERSFITFMIIGSILCIIATTIYFFYTGSSRSFYLLNRTKVGTWLQLIPVIIFWIIVLFIFYLFHALVFNIYKIFATIPPEDIRFTNEKIITAKKEWILNDDKRTLTGVKIETKKKKTTLVFSGTHKKSNVTDGTFNEEILVPDEEIMKAEKIVAALLLQII